MNEPCIPKMTAPEAQNHKEDLRPSEEPFRLLVEGVRDYAIFLLDLGGHVVSWNAGAKRIKGYQAEEIIGTHFSCFFTNEDIRCGKPGRELAVAAAEGRIEDENWRVRKDGSRFWANVVITALRDEAGNLHAFANITRDATERKRAEEELRRSEGELAEAQRIAHVGNWSFDVLMDQARWSDEMYRIFGFAPREFVVTYKQVLRLVHPEDKEKLRKAVRDALYGDKDRYSLGYRLIRPEGEVRFVHAEYEVARDTSERPVQLIGTVQDITERKRAEEALKVGEEQFRATFEQSAVGMAHVGPLGKFLRVNDRLCDILGYRREELLKIGFEQVTYPEDQGNDLHYVVWLLEGKLQTYSVEKRYIRKDGSLVWVNLTVSAVHDPSGEPNYFIAVIQDASDRKRTENALRESEWRYRTVVEQAAAIICFVDVDTRRIVEANTAFYSSLGYSEDELRRMTLYDIVAHERESVDRTFQRTLEKGGYFFGERSYRRKDGLLIDVEANASTISRDGKKTLCIVAHDITERKQAEEDLRQSLDLLLALREAGQILGSTLESEEIVQRLMQIMQRILGLRAVVISTYGEDGHWRVWNSVGLEALWERARYMPEAEAARWMARNNEEQHIFRLQRPGSETEGLVGLCLPLRMREQIFGVLEVYGPDSSLSESDMVEILDSLTSQAASALKNALLYEELAERECRLQELVGKILHAQEEEQRRVAYEVHDSLAQVAAAAHQRLQTFARRYPPDTERSRSELQRVLTLVRQTVYDARKIIANLRPTVLDDLGLKAAVSQQVEQLRKEGYRAEYEEEIGGERLSGPVEVTLFRVVQEALTNVRKHAQTQRVRIELRRRGDKVYLEICDFGQGFDPAAASAGSGPGERVGLAGMRERIGVIGGKLEIHSRLGAGTCVRVEIPLSSMS